MHALFWPRVDYLLTHLLFMPALAFYGWIVDPSTGHGGLPCLFKLLLGFTCPGCGLSRADALLVRGELGEALAANWLILPIWIVAAGSFISGCIAITMK